MKMKKLAALLLAGTMTLSLAACGNPEVANDTPAAQEPAAEEAAAGEEASSEQEVAKAEAPAEKQDVSLRIWGAEEDQAMLQEMIDSFKENYKDYANFDIQLGVESESTAKDTVLTDIEAAADVYALASDQLIDLVKAGALQSIDDMDGALQAYAGKSVADVKSANAEGFMEAGITAELGSLQKDGNIAGPDNGGKEQDDAGQDGSTGEQDDAGQDGSTGKQDDAGRGGSTGGEDNSGPGNSDRQEAAGTPAPSPFPGREPSPSPEPRSEPRDLETSRDTSSEPEPELPRQEAPIQETSAPELTLKVSEVRVKAGQGPAWVDIIGTLKDDKDDYATLFGNLSVGRYDRDKPGSYQVGVSTQDSDGNSSQTVPITIIVE